MTRTPFESDILRKLKWLMSFRVFFAILILAVSVGVRYRAGVSHLSGTVWHLYESIIAILAASIFYALWFSRTRRPVLFASVQIVGDTFLVSFLVWMTGSYDSFLSSLYLLVIIYASMVLQRKSLVIAAFCAVQYGMLIDLQYFGILLDYGRELGPLADRVDGWQVVFRISAMTLACTAVSALTSFLAVQVRRAKDEVRTMEDYVKRMETLAVVGEMAAGLAHEVKNPLASLSGAIELLREENGGRSPESETLMRIVVREADRLGVLVSEFLMFARPGKGTPEVLRVADVMRETLAIFEKSDRLRGRIRLTVQLDETLWVRMDPGRFRQVIWNLLLNASDAIEGAGGIGVDVRADRSGRGGVISISDTGCGIPKAALESIFDPFYTTKSEGTGLGLSIAARLLDAADGSLDVRSREGEGTIFTLRLPKVDAGLAGCAEGKSPGEARNPG